MKPIFILPLLGAAGLMVLVLGSLTADDSVPNKAAEAAAHKPWEHLALTQASTFPGRPDGFAKKINELGREGWELVCVSPVTIDGRTTANTYYFKRPL